VFEKKFLGSDIDTGPEVKQSSLPILLQLFTSQQPFTSLKAPIPMDIIDTETPCVKTTESNDIKATSRPDPFKLFPDCIIQNSDSPERPLLSKVLATDVFSFCGDFAVEHLSEQAGDFVACNSDAIDKKALIKTLQDFLSLASQDCIDIAAPVDKSTIAQSCWLTVRMSKPTPGFETPRWHRDGPGRFKFACLCARQPGNKKALVPHSKYAVTLLGPPSLVLAQNKRSDQATVAKAMEALDFKRMRLKTIRKKLARELVDCERLDIPLGHAIRFSWGQKDSPVHSKPDSSKTDRVFVSVCFGKEQEIRSMACFRKEEYHVIPSADQVISRLVGLAESLRLFSGE